MSKTKSQSPRTAVKSTQIKSIGWVQYVWVKIDWNYKMNNYKSILPLSREEGLKINYASQIMNIFKILICFYYAQIMLA